MLTSINPASSPGRREWLITFGVLWLFWAVGRWPQWTGMIWLADDYNMWEFSLWRLTRGGASQGRWLNGLWYSLYHIIEPPDLKGAWILRIVQGALHAGASTLMVIALIRPLGRVGAWLSVLLFHAWAFHGEATVWMAGSTYPLAAVLSLGGVYLIARSGTHAWGWSLLGAFLVAASLHSNQAPALIGGCFWVIWKVFSGLDESTRTPRRQLLREVLWIGGGYLVGGIISVVTMKILGGSRLEGAIVLAEKWQDWGRMLERLWWFPRVYPESLKVGHALLLGLAISAWIYALIRRWIDWRQGLLLFGLMAFLSIAPMSAHILAPERDITVRVLYGAPLIWVGLAGWLFWLGRRKTYLPWITGGLAVAILGWNLVLGVRDAKDYVDLYATDMADLRALEAFAAEHGCSEVLFMDWMHSGPWTRNPRNLRLYYEPSIKYPIMANADCAFRVITFYSEPLEMTPTWPAEPGQGSRWQRLRAQYAPFAKSLPRDNPIHFEYLPEEHLILVVPR